MTIRFRIFDLWIVHFSPLVFAMLLPIVFGAIVELGGFGWPLVAGLPATLLASTTVMTFGRRGSKFVYKKRVAFIPIQRLEMETLRISAHEDDRVWGDEPDWIEVGGEPDSDYSFMCDKPYELRDWIKESLR